MSKSLSIAEAAKATGLTAYTLRYYEQIGLIAPIDRKSGARRYSSDDVRWIEFLIRLRATGMPIRDMQRYARLLRKGDTSESLAERQGMLEEHAKRLETDLRMLSDTLEFIRGKLRRYKELRNSKRS